MTEENENQEPIQSKTKKFELFSKTTIFMILFIIIFFTFLYIISYGCTGTNCFPTNQANLVTQSIGIGILLLILYRIGILDPLLYRLGFDTFAIKQQTFSLPDLDEIRRLGREAILDETGLDVTYHAHEELAPTEVDAQPGYEITWYKNPNTYDKKQDRLPYCKNNFNNIHKHRGKNAFTNFQRNILLNEGWEKYDEELRQARNQQKTRIYLPEKYKVDTEDQYE